MPVAVGSRELVRRFLDGTSTDRPPIVLHLGPYAARLAQLTYREMSSDATLLANSLHTAQRLLGCDGLVILADSTLEAEACGCGLDWQGDQPILTSHPLDLSPGDAIALEGIERRGRLAVALEAARRLDAVVGKEVALFPAVTGPVTLAHRLQGPSFLAEPVGSSERALQSIAAAARVTVHVAKQYLSLGLGQLLVVDPLLGEIDAAHYPALSPLFRTLFNVADYFDASVLLQTRLDDTSGLDALLRLGAAGLVVEADFPLGIAAAPAGRSGQCLGAVIPGSLLLASGEREQAVEAWRVENCTSRGFFACSAIPSEASPESLHEILAILRT